MVSFIKGQVIGGRAYLPQYLVAVVVILKSVAIKPGHGVRLAASVGKGIQVVGILALAAQSARRVKGKRFTMHCHRVANNAHRGQARKGIVPESGLFSVHRVCERADIAPAIIGIGQILQGVLPAVAGGDACQPAAICGNRPTIITEGFGQQVVLAQVHLRHPPGFIALHAIQVDKMVTVFDMLQAAV